MEISLRKVLLNTISYFFRLSSLDNIKHEPAQKYYQMVEDILKLLKPVLDAAFDGDASFSELLQNADKELGLSIDELTELFKNWNPLRSKIDFVLEVESFISKMRASGVEILGLLKSSDHDLPTQFNASSIEVCIQKIKHMDLGQTSVVLNKAVREQEGSGPSAESLAKFADCFSLRSNQELLIEAVALEKLMDNAEQAENNGKAEYYEQLITLVTNMHERLFLMKQDQSCHPVSIPADFCCPLSLELMTDPVIVASGQTYERAFIRKWIDLGLIVCPKTRRSLSHTNLIPNYTVKALIANWCEINNVKLPDPVKSMSLNLPSYLAPADSNPSTDSHRLPDSRSNHSTSPEPARSTQSPRLNSTTSSVIEQRGPSSSHPRSFSEGSLAAITQNGNGVDIKSLSLADSGELSVDSGSQSPKSPLRAEHLSQGHNRNASASSLGSTNNSLGLLADSNDEPSQVPSYNNDAPREQSSEPQAALNSNVPRREAEFSPRLEMRSRSQIMFRRPMDRLVPRIVSSPTPQTRADLFEVENQVKILVENLQNTSLDEQRNATAQLRLLAKHNMDNRIVIASCGAISFLVKLLHSTDLVIQENAVTALLNLSINDNNKADIANVGAIEPLIHVLQTGSPEAKENSAATLFSLSVIEENKVRIGRSGAIKALVGLLGNGTPRGKKDASTALFNLSILHENKTRIVQAGAVKYLVELMDPAAGMVDKAVAVLANLATIQEGRTAIGQEGGIPVLVEVVELGSTRGKENAAAALLQLCTSSSRYCSMVIHEGAVPPLVALSQSGTPRAKEKAQALLSYFRNQRHGNAGRS